MQNLSDDSGLIPRTFCDDGDPLGMLLMPNGSTSPGCITPGTS